MTQRDAYLRKLSGHFFALVVCTVWTTKHNKRLICCRYRECIASIKIDDVEPDDDIEPDDGSADPTRKMRPAAPPRHVPTPQPVRSGSTSANGSSHREQYGQPVYGPHPAKPRPTPVPTNGNNGSSNRHDWPRTEFRSPDSSTG